jgi:formylglycine-generating enzyme required for sulfatase activity
VSDFRLDTYEITVGRFRVFLEAGFGTQAGPPEPGSGAHPKIAGSGWDAAWNDSLLPDLASLEDELWSCGIFSTWTSDPGENERRPIICISWFEAFAFCAWDGGRLPTEAEWNYAAAGGSEQRIFPWGNEGGYEYAQYNCGGGGQCDSVTDIAFVGSKPLGDSRWGQADMAGNAWEWAFDWFAPYLTPCTDCANTSSPSSSPLGESRIDRGGSFGYTEDDLITALRSYNPPAWRTGPGARCARDP